MSSWTPHPHTHKADTAYTLLCTAKTRGQGGYLERLLMGPLWDTFTGSDSRLPSRFPCTTRDLVLGKLPWTSSLQTQSVLLMDLGAVKLHHQSAHTTVPSGQRIMTEFFSFFSDQGSGFLSEPMPVGLTTSCKSVVLAIFGRGLRLPVSSGVQAEFNLF